MIGKHVGYYFGSKLFAAILNLISMALFVRLAGHEVYGGYIVAMAWAAISYSLSLQWLRFAFFASFHEDTGGEQIATYLRVLALGMIALGIVTLTGVALNLVTSHTAVAVYVIVTGLAAYDALHETARTRLKARTVAIGVMTRSVLILLFGIAALRLNTSALALALAFGAAHWGGALALYHSVSDVVRVPWSAKAAQTLWRSGRPLIPAFAVDSFGLQFDRLQLAHHSGLADVGPYGAVSDFIRQLMIVGSEAISGAYMALARADAVNRREEAARLLLGQAFRAYAMLTTFAAAFALHFADPMLSLLFGSSIASAVRPILLIILATNAIMVFRAYYFAQILFIDNGTKLLLIANVCHAITAAVLSVTLIPKYGAAGAAVSLMMGHLIALVCYAWAWRGRYVTDLPYLDAMVIAGSALAIYCVMQATDTAMGPSLLAHALNIAMFAALSFAIAWRFKILSINELAKPVLRFILRMRQGSAT
jgi:O-antigen/teichoic acid export membrane protein